MNANESRPIQWEEVNRTIKISLELCRQLEPTDTYLIEKATDDIYATIMKERVVEAEKRIMNNAQGKFLGGVVNREPKVVIITNPTSSANPWVNRCYCEAKKNSNQGFKDV